MYRVVKCSIVTYAFRCVFQWFFAPADSQRCVSLAHVAAAAICSSSPEARHCAYHLNINLSVVQTLSIGFLACGCILLVNCVEKNSLPTPYNSPQSRIPRKSVAPPLSAAPVSVLSHQLFPLRVPIVRHLYDHVLSRRPPMLQGSSLPHSGRLVGPFVCQLRPCRHRCFYALSRCLDTVALFCFAVNGTSSPRNTPLFQ